MEKNCQQVKQMINAGDRYDKCVKSKGKEWEKDKCQKLAAEVGRTFEEASKVAAAMGFRIPPRARIMSILKNRN